MGKFLPILANEPNSKLLLAMLIPSVNKMTFREDALAISALNCAQVSWAYDQTVRQCLFELSTHFVSFKGALVL